MKKIFKTFALMLLTALAFSSCVDVTAPYNLPEKNGNTNGGGGGGGTVDGTPVTCAEAADLANALGDGATSTVTYTITGYITQVVGDVSRNQQTFWMADTKDGGKVFEAYWANLPEGVTAFTVGMKVKITGKLLKYVNSNNGSVIPEMKNATVEILEDEGGGGGGTSEEGTPVTCAKAVELTNALSDNATSTETYTVTGYITEVIGSVSRNQQTFWMADTQNGGRVFEAYYANLPEGVSEFTVGKKVKVTGKLLKYVNNNGQVTPEIKNGDVVILPDDSGGGGGGEQGDVEHITIAEFLAKADPNTTYELTGTVSNIANTLFGNFDLVEGEASIYIYGLLDLNGEAKKFESLNIAEGDIVTLTGKYFLYNNEKPEIKNAQFVSVVKGDGGGGDGGDPTPGPGGDPVTDLVNGDFESWASASELTGWKPSAGTGPGNATYSQSTDAHGGTYACLVAAPGTTNKRLATQEITLEAGNYTFSFYAKRTTGEKCQARAGYVPMKADGTPDTYKYGDYIDIDNNEWTLISYDFELNSTTTLCLLVMNPKGSSYSVSQDILVDDATLVKK